MKKSIIVMCHFCELHGPSCLFVTQQLASTSISSLRDKIKRADPLFTSSTHNDPTKSSSKNDEDKDEGKATKESSTINKEKNGTTKGRASFHVNSSGFPKSESDTHYCEGCSLTPKSYPNSLEGFISPCPDEVHSSSTIENIQSLLNGALTELMRRYIITSRYPIEEGNEIKTVVKQACIRSLSCEIVPRSQDDEEDDEASIENKEASSASKKQTLKSQPRRGRSNDPQDQEQANSDGCIYFGDDIRGHVLSYIFTLKDSQARGFRRTYSILIISPSKQQLLIDWDFYKVSLDRLIKDLKERAAIVYENELQSLTTLQQRRAIRLDNIETHRLPSATLSETSSSISSCSTPSTLPPSSSTDFPNTHTPTSSAAPAVMPQQETLVEETRASSSHAEIFPSTRASSSPAISQQLSVETKDFTSSPNLSLKPPTSSSSGSLLSPVANQSISQVHHLIGHTTSPRSPAEVAADKFLFTRNQFKTQRAASKARSLIELVRDATIFSRLHQHFGWILVTAENRSQVTELILSPIFTSTEQDLTYGNWLHRENDWQGLSPPSELNPLNSYPHVNNHQLDSECSDSTSSSPCSSKSPSTAPYPIFGTLTSPTLGTSSATIPSRAAFIIRHFYTLLGRNKFLVIVYHALIGNQIILKSESQHFADTLIDLISLLLPPGCVRAIKHSQRYHEPMKCNLLAIDPRPPRCSIHGHNINQAIEETSEGAETTTDEYDPIPKWVMDSDGILLVDIVRKRPYEFEHAPPSPLDQPSLSVNSSTDASHHHNHNHNHNHHATNQHVPHRIENVHRAPENHSVNTSCNASSGVKSISIASGIFQGFNRSLSRSLSRESHMSTMSSVTATASYSVLSASPSPSTNSSSVASSLWSITLHSRVKVPERLPRFLIELDRVIQDIDNYSDAALNEYLMVSKMEWLTKVKVICGFTKGFPGGRRSKDELDRLYKALHVQEADLPLIRFWFKGLSHKFQENVFAMNAGLSNLQLLDGLEVTAASGDARRSPVSTLTPNSCHKSHVRSSNSSPAYT